MEKETKQRIRELMEEAVAAGTTAGVEVLVRQNDQEQFFGQSGFADREEKKPVCRNTIFRLYSMTKPITAAAAMILMEQGKLDLAQPVSDFLPGFASLMVEKAGAFVPAETPVTVKHLLNMTSGLTYGDEKTKAGRMTSAYVEECIQRMHTKQEVSTWEFANHMGTIPLAFEPDTSWCYGLSADVLGAVIEQAAGMRLGEFLKKYLFSPLGMEDTDFWVPREKQCRLATAYEPVGRGKMVPYTGDNLAVSNKMQNRPAFESGGAGLSSTIDDYARFAQMLLNGGEYKGTRILRPGTVRYLTHGSLTDVQQRAMRRWIGLEGYTYSNLMRRMADPFGAAVFAREGEYGWDGWLGCYFANFPKEQMTILLMQQKKDAGTIPMTRKIRNVILRE